MYSVPRTVYELKIGAIPVGQVVRHSCDNPICANYLNHLLPGTVQDNSIDAVERNRYKFGEQCHSAIFNPELVIQLRKLYTQGKTCAELARQFGCSDVSMDRLISGRTWKRVPGAIPTIKKIWELPDRRNAEGVFE